MSIPYWIGTSKQKMNLWNSGKLTSCQRLNDQNEKIKLLFRRIGDCRRLPGNTSSLIEFLRRKSEAWRNMRNCKCWLQLLKHFDESQFWPFVVWGKEKNSVWGNVSLQFWLYFCLYHVKYTPIFISSFISFWPYHDTFDILLQLNGAIQGIPMIQVIFNVFWYFELILILMWHELGTCSFETELISTRYRLALSGDSKEDAKDLHGMARLDW